MDVIGIGRQFDAWTEAKLHAVIVRRCGRLVYERYFRGEDDSQPTLKLPMVDANALA